MRHLRLPVVRYLHARPRALTGALVGITAAWLVRPYVSPTVSAVIGWDVGAAVFLALATVMVWRATSASIAAALNSKPRGGGFFSS